MPPRPPPMAERSTGEQMQQRYETAAELLAAGWSPAAVACQLSDRYHVTRKQARHYVAKGRAILSSSYGIGDLCESVLTQTLSQLQTVAVEAQQNGNYPAAVGALRTITRILEISAKLQPYGAVDRALTLAVAAPAEPDPDPPPGWIPF